MKKSTQKLIKEKSRKDFIEQGGQDGRYRTKAVPDKKKEYKRSIEKKINPDLEEENLNK